MLRRSYFLTLLLLLRPIVGFAREAPGVDSPAFIRVPELRAGFDLLYEQKFGEAREAFTSWQSRHPDQRFAEVAIAASYLFEELSRQGVLTSDFFLNEKNSFAELMASRSRAHDPLPRSSGSSPPTGAGASEN
jgi:hypothetical protein